MSEVAGRVEGRNPLGDDFVAEARSQLDASVSLIRHCLDQLDEGQVWWRPREGMNSIANLLLHLAGNLRQRFGSVIGGAVDTRDREAEFTERGPLPSVELRARFDEAARKAEEVLSGLTSDRLLDPCRYTILAGPTQKSVMGVIFQTLAHLNGHAQEILHMTRAQLGDRYTFRQPGDVPQRR